LWPNAETEGKREMHKNEKGEELDFSQKGAY